ncbi:MAG: hypothetical protein QW304_02490 [Thermoproteota archaeon]
MADVPEGTEYFLRVETYFQKGLRSHWPLIVDSLTKLSKHVSTSFRTEIYEDFRLTLFHEEEIEKFLHMSLHFSGVRDISMVDRIVDEVLELSELVEAYLTIKDDGLFQRLDETFYVEGVGVRVLTYPDKGVATIAYRLFKPNKGMHLVERLFKSSKRRKTVSERLRGLLGFKR